MSGPGKKGVVIVTGVDLAPEAVAILHDYELVYAGAKPSEDDLVRLSQQHQPVGIIVRYGGVTGRVMDASPALRVISKHGTGIDTIDSQAAQARGIAVKAAAGANAPAVAEHTWALVMACAKNVVGLDARMRQGHWDKSTHKSLELQGRTIGLVGLGAIGRRVAATAVALGMQVLAYDPFAKEAPAGVQLADLDTLFAASDVLSLHCPLTAENRHMINAASLARMKDGAILVNTARGGLIDEDAWSVLWVVDAPLFEPADEATAAGDVAVGGGAWTAVHHAFTSPQDLDTFDQDPANALAWAYDVVCNGNEIGGGSIRIHREDVQERVFAMMGLDEAEAHEKFGFLLDAFTFGAPPHGGIAFGWDRITALLARTDSIREVIAFPKSGGGVDPLTAAPAPITAEQRKEAGVDAAPPKDLPEDPPEG